jgi:hypothetical protein
MKKNIPTKEQLCKEVLNKAILYNELSDKLKEYWKSADKNLRRLFIARINNPPSLKDLIFFRLTYAEFYYHTKCDILMKKIKEVEEQLK